MKSFIHFKFCFKLAALSCALLLAACGGGESKTGSGGTGSVPTATIITLSGPLNALGPATGAGVAGSTLDDSLSTAYIDAGNAALATDLRLGMPVETTATLTVDGSPLRPAAITTQSAVVGPVVSVDAANGRFTIVSLSVRVDQNTILDGITSFAAITPGLRLKVFGLPQPQAGNLLATRVVVVPAGNGNVELLGNATGLSASGFSVQGLQVNTAAASVGLVGNANPSPLPPSAIIAENSRVRVIGTYNAGTGTVIATQVITGLALQRDDESLLVLDGLVQSVTNATRFRLNDTDVDAPAANAGTLAAGLRVQVRGVKRAGVLAATELRIVPAGDRIVYTVQGAVSDFISTANFKVRGEKIDAGLAQFIGNAAALGNGTQVRVKAVAGPGVLTATEVTLL